jgi:ATP-dependent RNA circularization protein (DNA/RNA ligase family)
MFRKYEKTFRLNLPGFEVPHKLAISKEDEKHLFAGRIVIEEKVDGANTGIIRIKDHYRLQKRGSLVDTSEHEQFNRFKSWASDNYDKIMQIPIDTIIYGEFMYAQHNIFYDQLPDWFLVFEIWDIKKQRYWDYFSRNEFCVKTGFSEVPFINSGFANKLDIIKLIPKVSSYGPRAEGIVIKKYTKKDYMRAKIVWPDFMKELDESDHWKKGPIRLNKLKEL